MFVVHGTFKILTHNQVYVMQVIYYLMKAAWEINCYANFDKTNYNEAIKYIV